MPTVTGYTATFDGVVKAHFLCPACGHRAGVITETKGTGTAATMFLFHDLAEDASRSRAEKRAMELSQLFTKSLQCPECSHPPPSPAAILLRAEGWTLAVRSLVTLLLVPVLFVFYAGACFGMIWAFDLQDVPPEPFLVASALLAVLTGLYVGYKDSAEVRDLYRRMANPHDAGFEFTEPGPPPVEEPSAWDLWRGKQ